ncbi:hypothetical protein LP7551_05532 [Roseibium album]|jgi:hypothetical protein|nr:hypothetical protein LP7551_05532 [Roseibium album]
MNFDIVTGFVRDVRKARRAANEIERMNHMGDAELAGMGLQRNEIANYAFNKHFKRR